MDLKVSSCGSGFIKNPEPVKMAAYVDGIVPLDINAELLGSDIVRNSALRYELEKTSTISDDRFIDPEVMKLLSTY